MSSITQKEIEITLAVDPQQAMEWKVVLFNCNCHTFETVIDELIKAIKCSAGTASQLAQVADQMGSVVVYTGDKEVCESIADSLGRAGLLVRVTR